MKWNFVFHFSPQTLEIFMISCHLYVIGLIPLFLFGLIRPFLNLYFINDCLRLKSFKSQKHRRTLARKYFTKKSYNIIAIPKGCFQYTSILKYNSTVRQIDYISKIIFKELIYLIIGTNLYSSIYTTIYIIFLSFFQV